MNEMLAGFDSSINIAGGGRSPEHHSNSILGGDRRSPDLMGGMMDDSDHIEDTEDNTTNDAFGFGSSHHETTTPNNAATSEDVVSSSDEGDGNINNQNDSNKELEVLIAQAMNSLSIEERRNALHDIHGVADIEDDDPTFISTKLNDLEIELCQSVSEKEKMAYYMAKSKSPAYVSDRDFRLLFLRADNFDVKAAAKRLARHFETKLDLFGPDVLGRDVRLSDLNELDMLALKSGFVQWLPHRDRAGRAVLFWTPGGHVAPITNRFKASFWVAMTVLRDKETQKRGMVGIVFATGPKMGNFELKAAYTASKLVRSLPMRLVANHLCTDKSINRIFLSAMLNSCGSFARVRIRCHYGPASDSIYQLMTFGISGDSLPVSQSDCTVKTAYFLERIEKRQQQEQEENASQQLKHEASIGGGNTTTITSTASTGEPSSSEARVIIPGPFDVLLGRGKQSQENVGNLRYRNLIASYQERYESARKSEKTSIADEVVQMVKQCSGRFLKEQYADFIEVSDSKAREKVSHSFRSLRSNSSKKAAQQNGMSGDCSISSMSTTTTSSTTESGRPRQHPSYKSDDNSTTKRAKR